MSKYRIHIAVRFFLSRRPSSRFCCFGNCTAGSKAI